MSTKLRGTYSAEDDNLVDLFVTFIGRNSYRWRRGGMGRVKGELEGGETAAYAVSES